MRRVLASCKNGYIVTTDGSTWRVFFQNGEYINTYLVDHGSVRESRYNYAVLRLGGLFPPSHANGFNILRGVGQCPEHPENSIVQVRNGQDVFIAVPNENIVNGFVFLPFFNSEVNSYCGPMPSVVDAPAPAPGYKRPPLNTFELTPTQLGYGAILVAIVVLIFTWK